MRRILVLLCVLALLFTFGCKNATPTPGVSGTPVAQATATARATATQTLTAGITQSPTIAVLTPTLTVKPTVRITVKPTARPTAKPTAKPTPTPKPTEKPLSVSEIMSIYEASMEIYNEFDFYNYHSSTQMDFTADGNTDMIYKYDKTSQGYDITSNGRYYINESQEILMENSDRLTQAHCIYNDDTYVYVKNERSWSVKTDDNFSYNQKCLNENAQEYLNMLSFGHNSTIIVGDDVTGVTKKVSGSNTIYTFSVNEDKIRSLIEEELGTDYSYTINSSAVKITVDADNNVIRDEYMANISIELYGKEGQLDIRQYCQYISLDAPTIVKPAWTEVSELVDSISEGH